MNGAEGGLGSTGVGTGVGVTPNGKALLGLTVPLPIPKRVFICRRGSMT